MPASKLNTLAHLVSGAPVPFGGDRMTVITPELAEAFQPGDHLLVLQETGDLLHIPAAQIAMAAAAVDRAHAAFLEMSAIPDRGIERFFDRFAALLEDPSAWSAIAEANRQDVERAQGGGRSTTRLLATDRMRLDMIAGLRAWRDSETPRGRVVERIVHAGWTVEQVAAPLGVVGFVFEGVPTSSPMPPVSCAAATRPSSASAATRSAPHRPSCGTPSCPR